MSNYISLKCKNCGATMEVDPVKRIRYCPYCGSADLIEESDAVKISKLNNETTRKRIESEERTNRFNKIMELLQNNDIQTIIVSLLLFLFVFIFISANM